MASEDGLTVEGDSLTVECIVTDANPQPHVISWFDWEGTKVSSNEVVEFNAVQRNQSDIPEVKVTFTDNASSTGTAIEGHSFVAECEVLESNPLHNNVTWFDSDRTVVSLDELVKFNDVSRGQSGNYTCVATNTFWDGRTGTGTAIMNVDVEYPPSVNEQTVFCVEHDLDVRLSCDVNSNPSPSFYAWLRNGDLLVHEHTYVINKANRSDSGNYTCRATSVFYD
ncbi:B-cell receptor CD22-like [Ptychodera flava]|uniref:B-cell receptor CD22-like n=1 Tax=Ptychodera flava TaxID=63121 RepID=UPI00396A8116